MKFSHILEKKFKWVKYHFSIHSQAWLQFVMILNVTPMTKFIVVSWLSSGPRRNKYPTPILSISYLLGKPCANTYVELETFNVIPEMMSIRQMRDWETVARLGSNCRTRIHQQTCRQSQLIDVNRCNRCFALGLLLELQHLYNTYSLFWNFLG